LAGLVDKYNVPPKIAYICHPTYSPQGWGQQ
jgi:hypothetical protein